MKCTQFVGAACGNHGPYVFYKAVKIFKHGKFKILGLGEFFFVRISPSEDPCIGELQLLWEDKSSEQLLSSVRLYFLPEQTPEGRKSHHGEHEVVAASEKVVLRLEDLRTWMTEEVSWCHGLVAPWSKQVREAPDEGPLSAKDYALGPEHREAVKDTKDLAGAFLDMNNLDLEDVKVEREGQDRTDEEIITSDPDKSCPRKACVYVLSYPRYCRYRSVLKRLNGLQNVWLKNSLVVALGGFALPSSNSRVLFCRDTFEHDGLLHNDLNCEHLAPNLKGKPRLKKRVKGQGRSQSPGSESNASEDSKETSVKAQVTLYEANNGRKPACKEEQQFLQKLFKFMQERQTPIHRVPHLGFKQIDLYFFFSCAQKLGGYDAVTCKKLWKQIYDEMGGNPGSTSAATCTRRHYERLLLPFERFWNGEEDHSIPRMIHIPIVNLHPSGPDRVLERQDSGESCRTEDEDIKPLSPLTLESEYASRRQEHPAEVECLQPPSSMPGVPMMINLDMDSRMELLGYQMIGQKKRIRDTAITEKERKWNEIRRKSAMARNWARQLRPVKQEPPDHDPDLRIIDSRQMSSTPHKVASLNPASFHPANNRHSSLSALSSTKPMPGHMTPRDYNSTRQTYHPSQYHHHRHHSPPSPKDPFPANFPNGFPVSKDGLLQRRPSVIQHTEKICSPPLDKHPMPAHLGSHAADPQSLRAESVSRVFHPDYDPRSRHPEWTVEVSGKCELSASIGRKPSTPMYIQAQQQRRQVYASISKDKVSGERTDSASKHQSSFFTALRPTTPTYSRSLLKAQDASPCETQVLDLSVKSKPEAVPSQNRLPVPAPTKKVSVNYSSEVCLDLSVKKRKTGVVDLSDEARGIENVTPPSPVDRSQDSEDKVILMPPMKSPIASLSLLRSAADKGQLPQRDVVNTTPPALIPIVDAKPTFLSEDGSPQNPSAKPLYFSDYAPSLQQFMTPPTGFPTTTSGWSPTQQSTVDSLQSNLTNAYKELVDHSVFSGPFSYTLAQRLYPLLYKDGNGFPSFSK